MSHAGGREQREALLVQDGNGILGRKEKLAVVTAPLLASPRAGLPVLLSPERLARSTSGHTRRCSEHCHSRQRASPQTGKQEEVFPLLLSSHLRMPSLGSRPAGRWTAEETALA